MKAKFQPLSLEGVKASSIKGRKSLVSVHGFARPIPTQSSFRNFLHSLPDFLAAKDFRETVGRIGKAHHNGKPVILGMGAHPIKVGLSPLIVRLMERGILQAVAMNGAGIIHDFEIAFAGKTSEEVSSQIGRGDFGMAEETGQMVNEAINEHKTQVLGAKYNLESGRVTWH